MVRETRHLWVGNLPENIREDRIREHFKRYGRVQSVKLLPRVKDEEGGSGVCATVSFIDIKSASKAHNIEQKLDDRTLSTEYHEPAAIPGGSVAPIYSSPRFSHGPPEEIAGFERTSHFYERRPEGDSYLRRSSTYHVSSAEPLRGRTRDRLPFRTVPYSSAIIESVASSRNPTSHHRSSAWSYEPTQRYPPPLPNSAAEVSYQEERRETTPSVVVIHSKKHSKSSRNKRRSYGSSGSNGSESGSNSLSSGSRSRSSSSSSRSRSSSCSSPSSSQVSDKSCSHSQHGSLRSGVTLQSAVSTPHSTSSPAVHSEDRRPLAICVRNLPNRSSDTSLKDGLFHEYKKHGKVTWVKVVGQGPDRYAVVCFKKPEDVEKALQVSHDKLFFGCKIEVVPYQGFDVEDNEFRPYEAEQDEFHPKATRTLFIGNLEKDITAPELRKHFDQFGEIIEIDIKKQGASATYAFCQYCDIGSVVRAMRTLDGEHLGNNRIKLGFGKSMHTNCVWVDGVAESVSEKYLSQQFSQFGTVSQVSIDRIRGHALVFFEQISSAQVAVKEMRGTNIRGRKLQVDFASRECQEAFYDHLEKPSNTFDASAPHVTPQGLIGGSARGFENTSTSSSNSGGGGGRYVPSNVRYNSHQQTTRSFPIYPRTVSNNGASPGSTSVCNTTPVRVTTPRHQVTSRFDYPAEYNSEKRIYRKFDEPGIEDMSGLNAVGIDLNKVVVGPPDIRHLQKERVALLEQLEDCISSGEEEGSHRRCKYRSSHSGDGGSSRPGTPLCDERPENLPPVEPRRTPRERPPDPLSLPLPRFASQVLSPKPIVPSPPASPSRPRSTSSEDSEPTPPSPEWEERLRSLDEKYEKWSGSRSSLTKVDASSLRSRHKLLDLDLHELQPSDIVRSVLSKRSVFDEDSKRLENFGEKYEPREFVPSRPGFAILRGRLDSSSPIHSPLPKSPAPCSSPASAKGLQYPFPSHPPVQPTTSVATTTAAINHSCVFSNVLTITSSVSSTVDVSKVSVTLSSSSCSETPVTSSRILTNVISVNYSLPKISPTSPTDKKTENSDNSNLVVSPQISTLEKTKSVQKSCTKIDKCDSLLKIEHFSLSCQSVSKNRRDSSDFSERRKSRPELCDVKQCVDSVEKKDILGEGDKTKDTEMCDRRKRRSSVDCKDYFKKDISENCDKSKEINEIKNKRRDSVDSLRKDDISIDILKFKLSEIKKECNIDNLETNNSNFEQGSSFSECNLGNKLCEYTKKIDSEEKLAEKKSDFDEDRITFMDNLDNSIDSDGFKKVPEKIECKKELELVKNQKDEFDKPQSEENYTKNSDFDTVVDQNKERFKEYHQDNIKNKEKKDISPELETRRKSKEIIYDNIKCKYRKSPELLSCKNKSFDKKRLPVDLHKQKDCNKYQLIYDEEPSIKHSELKRDIHANIKNKDLDKRKDLTDFNETFKKNLKDYQSKDIENVSLQNKEHVKRKENIQENNNKQINKKSELIHNENLRQKNISDIKREECYDNKSKEMEKRRSLDIHDSSKYKEQHDDKKTNEHIGKGSKRKDQFEYLKPKEESSECSTDIRKSKENDKKKDIDTFHLSKDKGQPREKEIGIIDYIKHKYTELKKDTETSAVLKNKDCDKKKDHELDNFKNRESELKKENSLGENLRPKDSEHRRNNLLVNLKHRESERKSSDSSDDYIKKEDKKIDSESNNSKFKEYTDYRYRDLDRRKEDKRKDKEIRKEDDREKSKRMLENEQFERQKELATGLVEKIKENCYEDQLKNDMKKQKSPHSEDSEKRGLNVIKKEKRREKTQNSSWPVAAIGCKRRLSCQDNLDDEIKRNKPERRDSKDSGRSSSGSSKKSYSDKHNKSFTKLLEEKIKEDREKENCHKKRNEETFEEKMHKSANRKDKRNSSDKKKDDKKKFRKDSGSESDSGSGDDEAKSKKHSIFDIVDDEPAYICMYDKVKARSTKNMQKLEEGKKQEKLKEKFSQLKECRAKREEKKRSTSFDEDSDDEKGGRKYNKLLLSSSDEEDEYESDLRIRSRKIMSDTSEDDGLKNNSNILNKPILVNSEFVDNKNKMRKITSDTDEDDTSRSNILNLKSLRINSFEHSVKKITSDTSDDDCVHFGSSKSKITRIHSDESEPELTIEDDKNIEKSGVDTSDLFSNVSDDHDNFEASKTATSIPSLSSDSFCQNSVDNNPVCSNEIQRKKSHKKKQKRQKKNDSFGVNKRHSSKKERRKSHNYRDGNEENKISKENRIKERNNESIQNTKREGKMEDIFGPLSDDSDKGVNKWQVSQIYGSDSESEIEAQRRRDKRRRERKARELEEVSRVLEAKSMGDSNNYVNDEHIKNKKKKRKRSKEEKIKHHKNEEESTIDRTKVLSEISEEVRSVNTNECEISESKFDNRFESDLPKPANLPCLIDSPPNLLSHLKKPYIPFRSLDEKIHETAVKSISENTTKLLEELEDKPVELPPSTGDDKPTPVISQEETEDAVAALLLQDSFGGGFESYPTEETTKPETPISEPDLQIDTDTEDAFDHVDLSRPPGSPDPSTYFCHENKEGLEERILAIACPENTNQERTLETSCSDVEATVIECNENSSKDELSIPEGSSIDKMTPKIVAPDLIRDPKIAVPLNPSIGLDSISNSPTKSIIKHHILPEIVKPVDLIHPLKLTVQTSEQKATCLNISENLHKPASPKTVNSHISPVVEQVIIKPTKEEDFAVKQNLSPVLGSKSYFNPTNNQDSKLMKVKPSFPSSQMNCSFSPEKLSISQPKSPEKLLIQHQAKPEHQKPKYEQHSSPPKIIVSSISEPIKVITSQHHQQPVQQVAKYESDAVLPLIKHTNTISESTKTITSKPENPIINHSGISNTAPIIPSVNCQQMVSQPAILISTTKSSTPSVNLNTMVQSNELKEDINVNTSEMHYNEKKSSESIFKEESVGKQIINTQENIQKISDFNDSGKIHNEQSSLSDQLSSTKLPKEQNSFVQNVNKNVQGNPKQSGYMQLPNSKQIDAKIEMNHKFGVKNQSELLNQKENRSILIIEKENTLIYPETKQLIYTQTSNIQRFLPQANLSVPLNDQKIFITDLKNEKVLMPDIKNEKNSEEINDHMFQSEVSLEKQIEQHISAAGPSLSPVISHLSSSTLNSRVSPNHHVHSNNRFNENTPRYDLSPLNLTSNQTKLQKNKCEVDVCEHGSKEIDKHSNQNDIRNFIQTKDSEFFHFPDSNKDHNEKLVNSLTANIKEETNLNEENSNSIFDNNVNLNLSPKKQNLIKEETLEEKQSFLMDSAVGDLAIKITDKPKPLLSPKVEYDSSEDNSKLNRSINMVVYASAVKKYDDEKEIKLNVNNKEFENVSSPNIEKTDVEIKKPHIEKIQTENTSTPKLFNTSNVLDSTGKSNAASIKDELMFKNENIQLDLAADNSYEKNKIDENQDKEKNKFDDFADVTMSPPDPVVAPLTPKIEDKGSSVFVNPGESSNEPCDLGTAQTAKPQDMILDTSKEDKKGEKEETVTTINSGIRGRGGRRRKATATINRGSGVITRRSRLSNRSVADVPSADVYEFRDDSEEETGRPRLILTIKSPPEPPPVNTTTRKSRRLLERDGSRNTVDDTIEDVIRGTRSSTRRGGRGTASIAVLPPPPPVLEKRKSPRRKQTGNLSSSSQYSTKEENRPQSPSVSSNKSSVCVLTNNDNSPSSPDTPNADCVSPNSSSLLASQSSKHEKSRCKKSSLEPMTLIDPVTGLLIPMRESEEGQYIPVVNDHTRNTTDANNDDSGEPPEKRMRNIPPDTNALLSRTSPVITSSTPIVPSNRPVVATATVMKASVSPIKSVISSSPQIIKPSYISNFASLEQIKTSISNPINKNVPVCVTKPLVVSRSTSMPQTVLTGPKPVISANTVIHQKPPLSPSVDTIIPKNVPLPTTPISINRIVAPAVCTSVPAKAIPTQPSNLGVGVATTPINHKAHLLQAVNRSKVPVAKAPTPMTPKAHILQSIGNTVNCDISEGVVGPGTPTPPLHGSLLTGSVASPPLRAHSQPPVVTGASSSRAVCVNIIDESATGYMLPAPSIQGLTHDRNQVIQAGLPSAVYETSLGDVVQRYLPPPPHYHHLMQFHPYLQKAAPYQYTDVKREMEEGVAPCGAVGSLPVPLELRRASPYDKPQDFPQVANSHLHGNPIANYFKGHLPQDHPNRPPSQTNIPIGTPPRDPQMGHINDGANLICLRYPMIWQGLLALKTDQAVVQMHFVYGNFEIANQSLPRMPKNAECPVPPCLRIAQRMRLEPVQLEGVARKMQVKEEHCMLLAIPCAAQREELLEQTNKLKNSFITYLQKKKAAGIVNIAAPGSQQAAFVVHIFPECDFANESLLREAPDLLHYVANTDHLLIVIATV